MRVLEMDSGGVLIYTCILGSLDKLGGVPPHNTVVEDKVV